MRITCALQLYLQSRARARERLSYRFLRCFAACKTNNPLPQLFSMEGYYNCTSGSIFKKSGYVRGVSGASCAASFLGSVLIILSYICFKRLRTKVREILVHLSVADSGVAAANLVGIVVFFDRFYDVECDADGKVYNIVPPHRHIAILCNVQAFFALYFTLSSILWTVSLAVYLYFLLVHHGTSKASGYFWCLPIFSAMACLSCSLCGRC